MKIKDINKYESTYYSIKCSINMSHYLPRLPFHGACWLKTFWADLVGVQKPLGPYIFLSMQKIKKKKKKGTQASSIYHSLDVFYVLIRTLEIPSFATRKE